MATYDALKEAIIVGDETVVEAEVNKALAEGADAGDIMSNGLIGGMGVVGKRFASGEMFLPEVLLSAEVMHKGLNIINQPESAILRVGAIADRAVVRDGQIVARPIMTYSLTYDHRAIDGAIAAKFMTSLIRLL